MSSFSSKIKVAQKFLQATYSRIRLLKLKFVTFQLIQLPTTTT